MLSYSLVGFLLTSTVMVQYQFVAYMLRPTMISPIGMLINPIVYGSVIGSLFGLYEIYARQQIKLKPLSTNALSLKKSVKLPNTEETKEKTETSK